MARFEKEGEKTFIVLDGKQDRYISLVSSLRESIHRGRQDGRVVEIDISPNGRRRFGTGLRGLVTKAYRDEKLIPQTAEVDQDKLITDSRSLYAQLRFRPARQPNDASFYFTGRHQLKLLPKRILMGDTVIVPQKDGRLQPGDHYMLALEDVVKWTDDIETSRDRGRVSTSLENYRKAIAYFAKLDRELPESEKRELAEMYGTLIGQSRVIPGWVDRVYGRKMEEVIAAIPPAKR